MRDWSARKGVVGVIKLGEGGEEVFFCIVRGDFVHTVRSMARNVTNDGHDEFGRFGAAREKVREEFSASFVDDSESLSVFVHGKGEIGPHMSVCRCFPRFSGARPFLNRTLRRLRTAHPEHEGEGCGWKNFDERSGMRSRTAI